jgi:uncharacterized membrane protein YeaQ/YmgE (transglycosylase-associated protein family)
LVTKLTFQPTEQWHAPVRLRARRARPRRGSAAEKRDEFAPFIKKTIGHVADANRLRAAAVLREGPIRLFFVGSLLHPRLEQKAARWRAAGLGIIMPDIVNLIIWLVAGAVGGNAAGELLKGDYDLGIGNTGYGALGGVVGALILQALIPALRGIDYGPILGQLMVAAACGAILTVIAGAVTRWRQSR